jgi:hypothetical protein
MTASAKAIASRVRGDRALQIALALGLSLLVLDLAFISAHAALKLGWIDAERLNLEQEDTLPEQYQHLKILAIAGMFAAALLLRRRAIYLAGMLAFAYFFLDDSTELHERFGEWSAGAWQLPEVAGLRAVDLGELIWAGFVAVVMIALLAWTWHGSTSSERRFLFRLGLVILAFAVSAVGIDMLHQLGVELGFFRAADVFGLLEDGGELLCMTAAATVVLH